MLRWVTSGCRRKTDLRGAKRGKFWTKFPTWSTTIRQYINSWLGNSLEQSPRYIDLGKGWIFVFGCCDWLRVLYPFLGATFGTINRNQKTRVSFRIPRDSHVDRGSYWTVLFFFKHVGVFLGSCDRMWCLIGLKRPSIELRTACLLPSCRLDCSCPKPSEGKIYLEMRVISPAQCLCI